MKVWNIVAAATALALSGCGQDGAVAPAEVPEAPVPAPAAAPAPVAAPAAVSSPAPGLGVAFGRAAAHRLRPCEETPRCLVLSDPAAEEFMRDLLTVQVFDGPLEAVAASEAGFMRDAEGRLMTTYGRFQPVAVERFEVNGRPGMRSVITCGISDPETGFHAGAGECLWAVVSDGSRSVVISSSGFANGLEAAEEAVRSVRFAAD